MSQRWNKMVIGGPVTHNEPAIEFVYEPVPDNWFRVLEVLSVDSKDGKPRIVTKLSVWSHDSPPDYHALSYAWSHEAPAVSILCNEAKIPVTSDLFEALWCISKIKGCQKLWVDAICINQMSDSDKSQQVANMHSVYKAAVDVYVWLGPSANKSHQAIRQIGSPGDTIDIDIDDLATRPEVKASLMMWMNTITAQHADAFSSLFQRPWFRRLWTYQEVVLARDITFFCGYDSKDGRTFLDFAALLRQTGFEHPTENYPQGVLALHSIRRARADRQKHGTCNFEEETLRARNRLVTEPLDRVYGFLGLAEGANIAYREGITIDYSPESKARVFDVYAEFGKIILKRGRGLLLLSYTSSRERPLGLPSWSPNLNSLPKISTPLHYYAAGWPAQRHNCQVMSSTVRRPSSGHSVFKGSSYNYVDTSPDLNIIHIWGAQVDVVGSVGEAYPLTQLSDSDFGFLWEGFRTFSRRLLLWLESNLQMCQAISEAPTDEIPEGFWRALVGDLSFDVTQCPCDSSQFENYKIFKKYHEIMSRDSIRSFLIARLHPHIKGHHELESLYRNHLNNFWEGRRMFTTVNGRIGFGSDDVEPGDLICMLYSGPAVYLLRKTSTEGTYSFICEGYTYGLMEGQSFDLMDRKEAIEQHFAIE